MARIPIYGCGAACLRCDRGAGAGKGCAFVRGHTGPSHHCVKCGPWPNEKAVA